MIEIISTLKKKIALLIISFFNRLPVKKNKIFLFSYYGSQYGCNPKYITEYILDNCPTGKFDLVWAFNDLKLNEGLQGIRKVRTMSLRYFYELCTSKVVITNFRTTDLFVKRVDQYYIQTWHSSLRLKQIEKDAESSLPCHYVEMAKKDSQKCDLLLSGCQYSTEIFQRSFWYNGKIFEHGTPRNDLLFRNDTTIKRKIIDSLKISEDTKFIMYAPTFRRNNNLDVYDLDYPKILEKLRTKFGGEWAFLIKLHPHLLSKSGHLIYGENIFDFTTYHDVQELLSVSDALVSDYSSIIFDFALTQRPCFLYVPDFDDYVDNDRKLYFDIRHLPFVSSYDNDDLINKIENFNPEQYRQKLRVFLQSINSFEDGRACERILTHISEICVSEKKGGTYETLQDWLYNRSF